MSAKGMKIPAVTFTADELQEELDRLSEEQEREKEGLVEFVIRDDYHDIPYPSYRDDHIVHNEMKKNRNKCRVDRKRKKNQSNRSKRRNRK